MPQLLSTLPLLAVLAFTDPKLLDAFKDGIAVLFLLSSLFDSLGRPACGVVLVPYLVEARFADAVRALHAAATGAAV